MPTNQRPRGRARPPRRTEPPKEQREKVPKLFALHLTIGLFDCQIALTPKNYSRFLMHWQLGGKDISLRLTNGASEESIVLRGGSDGRVQVRPMRKGMEIREYEVVLHSEWRAAILKEKGLALPPEETE